MGSLSSRPDVPSVPQPQIVYVPQPAPQPVNTKSVAPEPSPAEPEKTPEEINGEVREQNLLSRNRSRFGTVQTSFRGLLSLSDQNAGRKTLLGE